MSSSRGEIGSIPARTPPLHIPFLEALVLSFTMILDAFQGFANDYLSVFESEYRIPQSVVDETLSLSNEEPFLFIVNPSRGATPDSSLFGASLCG